MSARRIAFLIPIFIILTGASGSSSDKPDARAIVDADPSTGVVLDVPFIAQTQFQCGPASLAMVLRFYGVNADPDAIEKNFQTDAVAGTFTVDLLIAATDAGADAHWIKGDLESLKAEIDAGRPSIVFLNLAINPLPYRHFAVAVGHLRQKGREYLVLHSGQEAFAMVPLKKFLRQWKRTGNMMMTVQLKAEKEKP